MTDTPKLQLFETAYWVASLHEEQSYLGRSLLVCKESQNSLSELSTDEWHDLHHAIEVIEREYKRILNATMFNWGCLMNNAYQENEPSHQVHWQVRPRYDHPVIIKDKSYKDPNFGEHYDRSQKYFPEANELEEIYTYIFENFSYRH